MRHSLATTALAIVYRRRLLLIVSATTPPNEQQPLGVEPVGLLVSEGGLEPPQELSHMALDRFGPAVRHTVAVFLVLLPAEGAAIGVVGQHFEQRLVELVVASGVPEGAAAQEAIDIIVNAYRQPARFAIITATNAGCGLGQGDQGPATRRLSAKSGLSRGPAPRFSSHTCDPGVDHGFKQCQRD